MRIITNHALLVRYFPLLLFVGIGSLATLLHFSVGDALLALQLISWMSFALSAWLMLRILRLLSPGSRADSRLVFLGLGFVLAPVFLQTGMMPHREALGLSLSLAAFYYGLRLLEQQRGKDALGAAIFISLAVSVQISLIALLLPLALIIARFLMNRGKWRWLIGALLAGSACLLPLWWLNSGFFVLPFQGFSINWSPAHFFQNSFQLDNGQLQYLLPNILYLLFPLLHPGFFLLLPGLFLMAKKTDLLLSTKKALLICISAYLLLLGGLPLQSLPLLLPAYALLLLLVFPAWDRLYCYGFHFFERLTWWVLGLVLLVQLGSGVYWIWSLLNSS